MASTLTVFPDTNLFLQCKPLEELDWSLIGHEGDVDVIITRPVQSELDVLKAKGNTRQASRSRAASSLLARFLDASADVLTLKEQPRIRLKIALNLRPDPTVVGQLDFDHKDDQLVGIALMYQKERPQESVCLVTYDNGPMFSARAVDLPFKRVPGEWLLPPELDEAAKREAALNGELERLRNSEPKFEIRLDGADEKNYEITYNIFGSLSAQEEKDLLEKVFARYPEATDFGPKEPSERVIAQSEWMRTMHGETKEVFTPASPENIEFYKTRYAEWREKCRSYLRDVHEQLNKRLALPTINPVIQNTGSRPAEDALVELVANGHFKIARIGTDQESRVSGKDDDAETLLAFPQPPRAPQGSLRQVKRRSLLSFGESAALQPISRSLSEFLSPTLNVPRVKDPNKFYWNGRVRDEAPVSKLSLNCEQWRHAREEEDFSVRLSFQKEEACHRGRLTVSVHAANLSNPVTKSWVVKISVVKISPFEEIEKQIEELSNSVTVTKVLSLRGL